MCERPSTPLLCTSQPVVHKTTARTACSSSPAVMSFSWSRSPSCSIAMVFTGWLGVRRVSSTDGTLLLASTSVCLSSAREAVTEDSLPVAVDV